MSRGTIRSFISVDVEDQNIIHGLVGVQRDLLGLASGLKPVEPQNIHVTLWFLGNITGDMVDRIHRKMMEVRFKPFILEVRGVGAFPSPGRPRVVWAGIGRGEEELLNIYNQLEPRLRELGFRPDPRGFTPHITIARVKGRPTPALAKRIVELADREFGAFRADCIRLKRSDLTPKGPVYTTLREVRAEEG